MSRRREIPKREITPDPKYRNETVAKFVNVIMKHGKKSTAERIVYGAFDVMTERAKKDPLELFRAALDNVRPMVEVKSRRVGGATYQVPVEVRSDRQMALAMRWITDAARGRSGKSMGTRLADELMDAAEKRGNAVKKREDVHRMAEANKAFSHYRW
ncbi:MAG: 30S ribosomal protein S7 [Pseudomonadota bacterium]